MTDVPSPDPGQESVPNRSVAFWPQTSAGWVALALSVIAIASLFLAPLVTITFRHTFPVVDTWLMPTIMGALLAIAALGGLIAVWRRRERSILSLIVLALMTLGTVGAAFVLVGGVITGN